MLFSNRMRKSIKIYFNRILYLYENPNDCPENLKIVRFSGNILLSTIRNHKTNKLLIKEIKKWQKKYIKHFAIDIKLSQEDSEEYWIFFSSEKEEDLLPILFNKNEKEKIAKRESAII